MLMLAAIYPFVTAILYVLMPLTDGWPLWERTAVLAPIMVGGRAAARRQRVLAAQRQ